MIERWIGKNLLFFNFVCDEQNLKYIHNTSFQMIFASASLYYPYYRSGVDVSIPFFNPFIDNHNKSIRFFLLNL